MESGDNLVTSDEISEVLENVKEADDKVIDISDDKVSSDKMIDDSMVNANVVDDSVNNNITDIRAAIDDEKVFLCICGGYQIMGQYYRTWDGKQLDFMGLIDFYTEGHEKRMIGNYMFECDALIALDNAAEIKADDLIVGFENHSGQTFLGEGIKPIGKVLSGYGNNEKAEYEGMHYKNVFGAYCHGPMLPKNPRFCDLLLQTALDRKYGRGTVALTELDDTLENNAHNYMVNRLSK